MAGEEEREGGDEGDGDDGDSGVASISRRRLGDGDSADGRRRFREGRSVDSRYRSMVGSGDYNFTMWEEKKQCARSRGSTEIRNQRSRQAGTRTIGAGGLRPTVPQPEPEPMASQAEEIRGRLWPKMATTPVEAQRPLKRTLRADPLGGLVRSVRAQCSTGETPHEGEGARDSCNVRRCCLSFPHTISTQYYVLRTVQATSSTRTLGPVPFVTLPLVRLLPG